MTNKKKKSLKDICQNILMVCGVITALTGALGGVVDTFGIGKDKGGGSEGGGEPRTIIIEQRVSLPPGETKAAKVRISKTADISVGGEDEAAGEGDVPAESMDPADMPMTGAAMSVAPEMSLMGTVSGLWGWFLGAGLGLIVSIISVGWWVARSKLPEKE
jgi:hypothetical protein